MAIALQLYVPNLQSRYSMYIWHLTSQKTLLHELRMLIPNYVTVRVKTRFVICHFTIDCHNYMCSDLTGYLKVIRCHGVQ